nr:hypothetical protein [Tanacetum cinerariifolium]
MDQNIDFSGSDQIQTLQYLEIHPLSQEIRKARSQEYRGQLAEHRPHIIESLQNFRVIRKSSTSLKNTSQISPVHAIAPILSTKEPEHSFSMGYEHFSTTLVTDLDEVVESSIKNLVPIPSECEVTSKDESKCDVPIQDQSSLVFTTFSNPLFKDNDDLTSSDDGSLFEEDIPIEESKVYSNPLFDDDEINSDELEFHVESNFVESLSNHDALIESSQKIDYLEEFSELNAEIANTIVESFPSLPIPVQDGDSQREEIDIVTETVGVLPPSVKNDDDSKKDIHFLEELLSDNSIPLTEDESSNSDHQDNQSFPRPHLEPTNAEFDFNPDSKEEIPVVMNDKDEFDVSNDENGDYFPFMFVIRIFLP